MHSTKDCPLRSIAWLTVNHDNKVIHATEEMIELLDFDPTNRLISDIWQPLITPENTENSDFEFVSTVSRMFCICTHANHNNHKIIVCTDITDLKNHMFHTSSDATTMTRLTMYGTIEATYSLTPSADYCIGQPMMRYIHSEDVQLFCSGLNQATKTNSIAHFQIRLQTTNDTSDTWSQFTVMVLKDNRVLCFIQPINELQETPTSGFYQCSDLLKGTLFSLQSKFWYAIEHGRNILAKHLASSLIALFQAIWRIWHENKTVNDDQLIRSWVQSTKNSSEIERLCHVVSYLGISPNRTKSWLDLTLDQTSEWLLSTSTTVQSLYDHII